MYLKQRRLIALTYYRSAQQQGPFQLNHFSLFLEGVYGAVKRSVKELINRCTGFHILLWRLYVDRNGYF